MRRAGAKSPQIPSPIPSGDGRFFTWGKSEKTYGFFCDLWYDDKYHQYGVDRLPEGGGQFEAKVGCAGCDAGYDGAAWRLSVSFSGRFVPSAGAVGRLREAEQRHSRGTYGTGVGVWRPGGGCDHPVGGQHRQYPAPGPGRRRTAGERGHLFPGARH